MINYTTRNVNAISIIVSIIIFFLINSLFFSSDKMTFKVSFSPPEIQENVVSNVNKEKIENSVAEDTKDYENIENKEGVNAQEKTKATKANWIIEIPSIGLLAEIAEGTTNEILNQYVGHFEETQIQYGNIGLAAHNRGYPVNYFQNLKELEYGAEIIYKYDDFEMTYLVETMEIIENTNWEYLKNTEDNKITLITCVENEPKYRRCIQGVEKIESEEF